MAVFPLFTTPSMANRCQSKLGDGYWQFYRFYGLHSAAGIYFQASELTFARYVSVFGLWILICFLLQSLFAWKLLSLFTQERWLLLIGSLFFIFAPVCLFRLQLPLFFIWPVGVISWALFLLLKEFFHFSLDSFAGLQSR